MCLEVLYKIDRVWASKECVCCACDPSVHLDVSLIGVVYVYVCRSLRAGSQVFTLLMVFLCVIVHTMWSSKSLLLLCILWCIWDGVWHRMIWYTEECLVWYMAWSSIEYRIV